ncbi:MAG: hypothetical protein GY703_04965 [Gammaproteobacteria bacterium]|nr:hypothetical protein [Gammaproteobacteria bacterium]
MLGIYMVAEGLRMPGAGGYIEAGGEPGRVPVMLGCILALLAMVLLIRSVKSGGHRLLQTGNKAQVSRRGIIRGLLTAVWCSSYALLILGMDIGGSAISYQLATAVFLFVFIVGFEWPHASELGRHRWNWLDAKWPGLCGSLGSALSAVSATTASYLWLFVTAGLQTWLVTWAIAYLFEQKFYVQLP